MAINVFWSSLEQTALIIRYKKPWTWAEFDAARNDMLILLNEVSHPVTLVIDVYDAGLPPEGAFKRFKSVAEISHRNVKHVVFVAPRPLAQFIKSMMRVVSAVTPAKTLDHNFNFATTLGEALLMLPVTK